MPPIPLQLSGTPVSAVQTAVQASRCVRDRVSGGGGRELQWGKEKEQRVLGYGKCGGLFSSTDRCSKPQVSQVSESQRVISRTVAMARKLFLLTSVTHPFMHPCLE